MGACSPQRQKQSARARLPGLERSSGRGAGERLAVAASPLPGAIVLRPRQSEHLPPHFKMFLTTHC